MSFVPLDSCWLKQMIFVFPNGNLSVLFYACPLRSFWIFFTFNRVLCTCGKIPWYSARNLMRSCWPSQPISVLLSILGLLRSFCFTLVSSGNKKHGYWGILSSNQTEFFEMLTVAYSEIIIHSVLCFVLHLVSGHCTEKFVGLQWEAEDPAVSPFRSWNLIRYAYFICVR